MVEGRNAFDDLAFPKDKSERLALCILVEFFAVLRQLSNITNPQLCPINSLLPLPHSVLINDNSIHQRLLLLLFLHSRSRIQGRFCCLALCNRRTLFQFGGELNGLFGGIVDVGIFSGFLLFAFLLLGFGEFGGVGFVFGFSVDEFGGFVGIFERTFFTLGDDGDGFISIKLVRCL
jgi:hypothetical protein